MSAWLDLDKLDLEVREDPDLEMIVDLNNNPNSHPHYQLNRQRLLDHGEFVILIHLTLLLVLLNEFHSTTIGGHFEAYKTYKKLIGNVYWKGMMEII